MYVKKILIHINSLGIGGAEHVVKVLSDGFSNYCFSDTEVCGDTKDKESIQELSVSDGYEVVLTTEWQDEEEYAVSEKVRRVHAGLNKDEENKGRIYKLLKRIINLRKIIIDEKPDVVISFVKKANYRASFALTGLSIPLIISIRNDPQRDYSSVFNKIPNYWMTHKARGCVFQTDRSKNSFGKDFEKKSTVILNPIDEKYIEYNKNYNSGQTENTDSNNNAVKSIISVGRITGQKNHMLLIKAFECFLKRLEIKDSEKPYINQKANQITDKDNPDFVYKNIPNLYIYGKDGGYRKELEEYIYQSTYLKDRVIFKGTEFDMIKAYQNADMFILSSDYEGMPNVLLEAMAMGLPCIATDCPCGGPAELIDNGVNGMLVPVGDIEKMSEVMCLLYNDNNLRNNIAIKARDILSKVDPDSICRSWMEYIKKVCNYSSRI